MKKGIIIVLAIILVMIISTICIININNSKNEKIYSQENEQFEILIQILLQVKNIAKNILIE